MRCKIFALKALLFPTINFGLKKKAVGSPDFHFSIFADSTQHHVLSKLLICCKLKTDSCRYKARNKWVTRELLYLLVQQVQGGLFQHLSVSNVLE